MPIPETLVRPAEAVWKKTQQDFAFPFLALKLVERDAPPVRLVDRTIEISAPFVCGMQEIGVEPETTMQLLAAREVNAWIRFPRSFHDYLELYASIRQAVYSETASSQFHQAYLDLSNDLDLCCNHGLEAHVVSVYRASLRTCGASSYDNFYRVLAATLAAKAGIDFETRLDSVHTALVAELSALDYFETADRVSEIRSFGEILMRVFFFRPESQGSGVAGGGGRGKAPEKRPPSRWPLGGDSARDLGALAGLEEGIARFTGKLTDTDTADLLLEALSRLGASGIAVAGFSNGRWWWYRELARDIPIEIHRKLALEAAPAIPVDLTSWVPEDGTALVNPFASMGRVASPGITQRWRVSGEDSQYQTFVLPSLLVLIDSSGSMPNPSTVLSYPVLAGAVIASTYRGLGSSVSVYNFSDADLVLDFTEDESEALRHIAAFKCGGTEVIKTEIVTRLLESARRSGRDVDLLLITDMQLSADELNRVMQLVRDHQEVHRLFLLVNGPKAAESHTRFAATRVKVYSIDSKEDIVRLALGVIRESDDSLGGQAS